MTSNIPVNTKDVRDSLKGFFRPEFVNRLDEILVFNSLKKEHIRSIVDIQISRLLDRLSDRHIKINLDEKAKNWLAENGYDEAYGARPLKRLIQQEIENPLAIKLLSGEIKDNSTIEISANKNGLVI